MRIEKSRRQNQYARFANKKNQGTRFTSLRGEKISNLVRPCEWCELVSFLSIFLIIVVVVIRVLRKGSDWQSIGCTEDGWEGTSTGVHKATRKGNIGKRDQELRTSGSQTWGRSRGSTTSF